MKNTNNNNNKIEETRLIYRTRREYKIYECLFDIQTCLQFKYISTGYRNYSNGHIFYRYKKK